MKKDLSTLADEVEDEKSFLEFVRLIGEDWIDEKDKERKVPNQPYSPGANGWENGDIGSFFEAAHAWGETSINGHYGYKKTNNPWKRVAQILRAGMYYE